MNDDSLFAALTADLADESYRPFRALFEQAQTRLQHEHPDGVDPAWIGLCAWKGLRSEEQEAALADLFYVYWSAQQCEADEQARFEWQISRSLLDALDESVLQRELGCQTGASVKVERARLARVLAELERLQLQVDELARQVGLPGGGEQHV
ncbi:hypothetical protein ADK76_29105 [Streptomyces griseoflavus]|uniref:hypothetical protein n=1 Tax=Streptomyces rimosus TaxID=1927 RepID=UPI0004CBF948|nr:hypothetical protein [Streptomyces rimosus]KOG53167.1 hypothetical protein ADK76_29105 [Streptomyces griseoflavus]